ncbi:class I mannose-6-phosphate isomerase [Sphingopyxis terrae]|uniref:class I mannose-6-phosphate isomerase n=1 Tax=Sphingopyxis terrae TaxID=33052 RepID=UPI00078962A3|nr:class I mannose-6-phosphate isomerase [Sphingopyxis terrae]
MLTRLPPHIVEKPWGRTDIPAAFGDFGERRIGEIWFAHPDGDAAPLMIKFLFTSERLSIQVHPDDVRARAAGYARGKDECWLILGAEPGAELGLGLKAPADVPALRAAAQDGSIVDMVDWRPAQAGEFFYNAAGTIHAIGGGLTLVEVQQNSECTYRLFDYGRPRDLHLDDGLAVVDAAPSYDAPHCAIDPAANKRLVDGPHFHLLHLGAPFDRDFVGPTEQSLTLVPLADGCRIGDEPLPFGEVALLEDLSSLEMAPGARVLLCWAA